MAHPATDLHFPPSWSKTFVAPAFGAQIVLSGTGASSAPAGVEHMPCQVIIGHTAADVFAYTDNAGVVNTLTFPASGCTVIRLALNTIETTTTADFVTVCWQAPIAHV